MKNKIIIKSIFIASILLFSFSVYADTQINLQIKTNTEIIYDKTITVTPCDSDNDVSTPDIETPYCAILQSGIQSIWDWTWAPSAFVTSINNIAGSTTKDKEGKDVYHYWSWSLNGIEAMNALNQQILQPNDIILLNFIDPVEIVPEVVETKASHSSGGSYIIKQPIIEEKIIEKTFSVENALKFLEQNQKVDGSFGDYLYTDWTAISVAAGDSQIIKEKLIKYLKENNLESNLVTDNERHAMALMALGINPYNGTEVNYIKKITDSFDGEQFGDKNTENDDIFALIVLKNTGYILDDEIINVDIKYLISKQDKDGSWGSIDMTAAYIEAMKGFENITGVSDSVSKSKNYIILNQKADGGFENTSSTSWALQSLYNNEPILKAGSYLASKQDKDGGMETIETDMNTRIWATSYAIPAILHKPWNEILKVFPRQGLGEEKFGEVKKINKEIIKKSVRTLEDRAKIENLIEDNNLPQNSKTQSKASRVWGIFTAPFSWLLDKLSF